MNNSSLLEVSDDLRKRFLRGKIRNLVSFVYYDQSVNQSSDRVQYMHILKDIRLELLSLNLDDDDFLSDARELFKRKIIGDKYKIDDLLSNLISLSIEHNIFNNNNND